MDLLSRLSHLFKLDFTEPAPKVRKAKTSKVDWRVARDHPTRCQVSFGLVGPLPPLSIRTPKTRGRQKAVEVPSQPVIEKVDIEFKEEYYLLKKPQIFLFFGKTQGGKSTCARAMIAAYQADNYFQGGLVLTTTGYNKDWNCMPKEDVWDAEEKGIEEYLLEYLRKLKLQADDTGGNCPPTFIVFDDCTDILGNFKADVEFKNAITKHHHLNLTIFFITHRYSGACTLFRENAHGACVYQANTESHLRMTFADFGLHLPEPYNKYDGYKRLVAKICLQNRALLFIKDRDQPVNLCLKAYNVGKHDFKAF